MFQCPLCRSNQATVEQTVREYRIMRCAACAGLSTFPIPQEQVLRALYDKQYYQGAEAARFGNPAADFIQRLFRWDRARTIRRKLGENLQGKRILDVGCERGFMLACLQRWGADVFGVQISKPAAAVAARLIGAERVFVGDLAAARYPDAWFDYVTLWHVLEHVPDPIALLREIRRILKPKGIAYIEVPNAGGYSARVFGASWLAYDIPRHLVHFSPSTLQDAVRKAGLACVSQRHFSLEYSPVTLLQSVLNVLLGGENRLFQALSKPREHRGWVDRVRLTWHLTVAAVLAVPITGISWLLGRLRAGETLGMYLARSACDALPEGENSRKKDEVGARQQVLAVP